MFFACFLDVIGTQKFKQYLLCAKCPKSFVSTPTCGLDLLIVVNWGFPESAPLAFLTSRPLKKVDLNFEKFDQWPNMSHVWEIYIV